MAQEHPAIFWIDTFSKVVMPLATLLLSVAIFQGTSRANEVDRQSKAKAQCRDGAIRMLSDAEATINLVTQGAQPKVGDGSSRFTTNDPLVVRAQSVDVAGQFLLKDCEAGGLSVPIDVQRTLCTLRNLVPDTDVQVALQETADEIARKAKAENLVGCKSGTQVAAASSPTNSTQASGPTTVSQNSAATVTSATPAGVPPNPPVSRNLRLFVQYPRGTSTDPLEALKTKVESVGLAGHRVRIPGFEAVNPPASTTLRCLKVADCAIANQLAKELGAMLHADVQVLDLSGRYDSRTDVKLGSIELWLAPQDIHPAGRD